MVNRREFLGITAGAGAALALTPQLLRGLHVLQQSGGTLIQRAIPASGEKIPVVGLGFANHPSCADPAALKEVLQTFYDNGGRFFDTNHGNAPGAQQFHANVANELGIHDKLFWSVRAIAGGGGRGPVSPEATRAHFESLFTTFRIPKFDLILGYPDNDPAYWAIIKDAKKAGRIRYIGAMIPSFAPPARVDEIMRNQPLDFVGVDYNVERRDAEKQILPLALERKFAVMAFFPFGGANGYSCAGGRGLFARIATTPLPEWSAEFDAKTWAQFFLKYVISHPAVTTARVGTTKAHHMLDNIGGGIGRVPDEAMRKRMEKFIDALPFALPPAQLARFVGEYAAASGLIVSVRQEEDKLFLKTGDNPEVLLIARSYTRFEDSKGSFFEFDVAPGQQKALRVILERGSEKITLERSAVRSR
jgi:aryl-alcohol dehydrogenase-like predicted oxidoreductase